MRYIEVKDGFSIAIDKIEALERIDEFRTNIMTATNSYEANFPYTTLMAILESEGSEKIEEPKTNELLQQYLKDAGTFAG